MQLLFDIFPVIVFFVVYKLADIYVATGAIIVAVIVQISAQWLLKRKISSMALTSSVLVLVFGGLTLLIHDKAFIQWKVTVVNWLFAAAFLGSQFVGERRPLIERMMGEAFPVDRSVWLRLNLVWVAFCIFLGTLNLYVAYNYSEAAWVNFKLFGVIGLTAAFLVAQGFWLYSKIPAEDRAASDQQ